VALVRDLELSSPHLITIWAGQYGAHGEDGLRPKPKGQPRKNPEASAQPEPELQRLRREDDGCARSWPSWKSKGLERRGTALKVRAVIALKAEHRLKVLLDVTALAHLLKRQFDAAAPNQKWVTGVTEFSVGDRQLYQSPIMDVFDRQIISYAIGAPPNLKLANASLRGALAHAGGRAETSRAPRPGIPISGQFLAHTLGERRRGPIDVTQSQLLRQCRHG
jgi:transposase InsO family protein